MFGEWLKQLFAESEGKDGKGIFPATSMFSRDLHSLGQFIQEGNKILFETFIVVRNNNDLKIGSHDMNEVNNNVNNLKRVQIDDNGDNDIYEVPPMNFNE